MIDSLEDVDLERLSADARDVLATIAPRMADAGDAKTVGDELGLTAKQVNEAMSLLREEMLAQKHGAIVPPLRDDDYDALKESIQQYGQLYPILTYRGRIIDGAHRQRACEELGIAPMVEELVDVDDPRAIAIAANTARRQLTAEQRRKIVAAELLYDPKASDRRIAAVAGVSHVTVGKVRAQLEKRGLVVRVTTRQDALGRDQHQPDPDPPPEVVLATQTGENEEVVTFQVSQVLIADGGISFDEWSAPLQLKLSRLEDGGCDLIARMVD